MKINIEVKQYEGKDIDIKKLDKTDAVAVFGPKDAVISTIAKNGPGFGQRNGQ